MKWKLKNVFRVGEMYHKIEWNGKTFKNYPSVLRVSEGEPKTIVFKVPKGMNPKDITKKEYVFKQYLGERISLKEKEGVFVLEVFSNERETTFNYDYETLKDVMKYPLSILAGKNEKGVIKAYNMVEHPHLLIAGETGSGKSVALRMILTSLILHYREGLELYLGDMKRSEFHFFRDIDIVKESINKKKDLIKLLKDIEKEMDRRGDLLDQHEVAHVDELPDKIPYIIICIDEVARLQKENDVMDILEDISCVGRALGIFLILSMQRPDAKVLDGQLKNNLTVRYAFKHADRINSNITLGQGTKEDASTISDKEPGTFYMRYNGIEKLKAPYLTVEKAKELLKPYKVKSEKKEETNFAPLGDFHE